MLMSKQKILSFPNGGQQDGADFFFNKEHYKLINSTLPSDVQKAILPESSGRITRTYFGGKLVDNAFWFQVKKDIKKIYFEAQNMLNFYQESYFLYDRSNVAKQPFVNELSQFLTIYCLVIFFGEKKNK